MPTPAPKRTQPRWAHACRVAAVWRGAHENTFRRRERRLTEERARKAAEQLEAESSARDAVEKTLLSLERVREQGENVVKVEMDMRKDLGRDLVTAMETVGQLEKQVGNANRKLKQEREARKKVERRAAQLDEELEQCQSELSSMRGKVSMAEHEMELKARVDEDYSTAVEDLRKCRVDLAGAVDARSQMQQQLVTMQQEMEAVQRNAQHHLIQSQNEARLKEQLQARGAEDFQAYRAQASVEMAGLREKQKRSKMSAVQAETALQEALAELRGKEREVQNLNWRVDRISELITAQQRLQPQPAGVQPIGQPLQQPPPQQHNFGGGAPSFGAVTGYGAPPPGAGSGGDGGMNGIALAQMDARGPLDQGQHLPQLPG
jgi:chromosome segregation ATPase